MHRGYIKLYRRSVDNPYYFSEPFTRWQAWTDLIMLAAHKKHDVIFRGKAITLEPGQLLAGSDFLASRWLWSRSKVRTFLKTLGTDGLSQICHVGNGSKQGKIAIISLINYEKFNQEGQTENKSKTSREQVKDKSRTSQEQVKDTPKHLKHVKALEALEEDEGNRLQQQIERFWNVNKQCSRVPDYVVGVMIKDALAEHPQLDVMEAIESFERDWAGSAFFGHVTPQKELRKYLGYSKIQAAKAGEADDNSELAAYSKKLKLALVGEGES